MNSIEELPTYHHTVFQASYRSVLTAEFRIGLSFELISIQVVNPSCLANGCISMEWLSRRHTRPAGTTTCTGEIRLSGSSHLNGSTTPISETKQLIPLYVSGRSRSQTCRLSMDRSLRQYTQAAGITLCVDEMLLPHSPPLNGSVVLVMHQSSWYHHTSQRDTALRPTTSQRNTLRDYTPEPLILPQRC